MTVIQELVDMARERARNLPAEGPVLQQPRASFTDAIAGKDRLSVIAEFKRSSPSEHEIAPERGVESQVRAYAAAGAAAVSVLTEPSRFGGSFDHLLRAAGATDLPLLMKDFVVSPVQVRMAACLGASAVLLIVCCLERAELAELAETCRTHGLTPLIECHDEAEIATALEIRDAVIGVNNRNLATLQVDRELAPRLLPGIPEDRIAVAESGYEGPDQVQPLRGLADAVLIGTSLMRSPDPAAFIAGVTR